MLQTNVRIIKNHIPQVMAELLNQQDAMPQGLANFAKGAASAHVPVDLGNLRRSIKVNHKGRGHYSVSAKSTEGGAPRDYAHYVEFGTRYTPAQPYMVPAYHDLHRVGLPEEIIEFRGAINRAAR